MLFDDANRKLIAKYFVPIITDPPWAEKGRERRNPEMWDMSESWKKYPRSAELVWLVSADKKQQAGIDYSKLKKPEALNKWLQSILIEDGDIKVDAAIAARIVSLRKMRAAMERMLVRREKGEPVKKFRKRYAPVREALAALTDDDLCPAAEAKAIRARIESDRPKDRDTLVARFDILVELCGQLDAGDVVAGELARRRKGGKLSNCLSLEAATRCLSVHGGKLLRMRKTPPGAELTAKLAKLGIQ